MNILIQGAGRGLGLALAHRARAAGNHKLFLTARTPENAQGFAELPPDANTIWLTLDITQDDEINAVGTAIKGEVERLDRVICTSGMLQGPTNSPADEIKPERRVADLDRAALLHLYAVNALGPVLLARELWPVLRGKHPLHFAAISARVGSIDDNRLGGWYSYRASKAALNQLMRTLSIELARANEMACVATLHPGTVDTDLSRPFQANLRPEKLFTPAYSADCMWQVLDNLKAADTGGFFAYDGSSIPF